MGSHNDHRVWIIARRQGGIMLRRQLLAIGLTDRMIEHRVADRGWLRIKPGVFLLPGFPADVRSRLAAATAALPAVVSHQSAAELHGMPHVSRGLAIVTVPIRTTHVFAGVVVHQSTDLSQEFVVTVSGLPATTVARTIVDLAAVLSARTMERLVDDCLVARLISLNELSTTFDVLARRGKPGVLRLRSILEARRPGYVAPESELERLLVKVLEEAGLPQPVLQHPLPWHASRPGRVDAAYPEARVLIEADSRRWHTLAEAFEADRRRDNLAMVAGWRVLRFTWRELKERPDEVCRMVQQALAGDQQHLSA